MVPESPSVCFRCKMCKVCFLTMNEIERHLKATNHYIRPSSNNNNNNNTSNSSTKDKPTAIDCSDDKPLNLSSKSSVFSPHPTPSPTTKKPAHNNDLSLSSGDCEGIEGKRGKGASERKNSTSVKLTEEEKPGEGLIQAVVSRKTSSDDSCGKVSLKNTAHEDIADVETDTVSSTSSEPPPPSEKTVLTPPLLSETREAETSTQVDEGKLDETCSTTQVYENGVESDENGGKVAAAAFTEAMQNKDVTPPVQCNEKEKIGSPMMLDDQREESVSTTEPSQITTTVSEEKATVVENGKSEECEMSPNENDEPEANNKVKADATKMKNKSGTPSTKKKNRKQRYRCKHCAEMFSFPVQVHMHMRKVHSSVIGESPNSNKGKVTRRRSSLGTPSNNNNNNEKANVQMYPLRSLDARAKRRTRSMLSDTSVGDGGRSSRRSSLGHHTNNNNNNNNIEVKKDKKGSTTNGTRRKPINFTCRHCGKKFQLLNQLKMHLHKMHPGKVKKDGGNKVNGDAKDRQLKTSKRLVQASKTRQQQRQASVQSESSVTRRISTRSISRSAESEPEMERRMSTRRSSLAKSDKSGGLGSAPSSRRSSTRRDTETKVGNKSVKQDLEVDDAATSKAEKVPRGKVRCSSSSSGASKKRRLSSLEEPETEPDKEIAEDKLEMKMMKLEEPMQMDQMDDNEEDTIYNDSDCMIIDTVETILYALTSKRSQTCPNCNKYCKFAGNFKLHLKACMNLDDDLVVKTEHEENEPQKLSPVKKEKPVEEMELGDDEDEMETDEEMEEQQNQGEEEEEEGEDDEEKSESAYEKDGDDASVPYYQKLDYRRCWECGFIVSKFHNLSRHLKQRHNISMGTKEMHAKQAEILRLK